MDRRRGQPLAAERVLELVGRALRRDEDEHERALGQRLEEREQAVDLVALVDVLDALRHVA